MVEREDSGMSSGLVVGAVLAWFPTTCAFLSLGRAELIGLCIKLNQGAQREVVLQNLVDFADADVLRC